MRILGIDPGLARVGYGVIDVEPRKGNEEGTQRMVDCGIIRTDPGRSEGKFFFYRSSNTIAVVQARGVLIMTLTRFGLPIVEFPPMQIKQALPGHGHADKDEVLEAVMRELNLNTPPRPDDAADALAVALTGWFQR